MLGWMKGTQSDHPLALDKAARELIAELPANDSIKTLEELAFWLDSLKTADDLKVGRLVEIVDLIDSSAKNHQRKLSQEYLTGRDRADMLRYRPRFRDAAGAVRPPNIEQVERAAPGLTIARCRQKTCRSCPAGRW